MTQQYEKKSFDSLELEQSMKKCPDCGCKQFDIRGEERFCKKCGLVIE
jgi:membrane protease subunit (stomatin/prohibitin family)